MRTSLRATIAVAVALGVLLVAAVAFAMSNDPAPPPAAEPTGAPDDAAGGTQPAGGGAIGMCAPGYPDCVDTVVNPDGEVPPNQDPAVDPQVVEPRSGMTNVYARMFDSATVGDDGRTVTIDFWSGVEPCYVLDHVDVASTADEVTITLFEGSEPTDEPVACIEIGVLKRVMITLDEPLGDREIVDGAEKG